jgi:hypothetical protein
VSNLDKTEFTASLAESSYPIKIKENFTVVLEIPLSEMAEAIKLVAMQGKPLKVTIEIENAETHGSRTVKRTAAKKRV